MRNLVDLDTLLGNPLPHRRLPVTASASWAVKLVDGYLTCPQCDFDHIHHCDVTVYAGGEDAKQRTVIFIKDAGDQTLLPPTAWMEQREAPDNPSPRRGAIVTTYCCEGCHGRFHLVQAQHKGRTEMLWEAA